MNDIDRLEEIVREAVDISDIIYDEAISDAEGDEAQVISVAMGLVTRGLTAVMSKATEHLLRSKLNGNEEETKRIRAAFDKAAHCSLRFIYTTHYIGRCDTTPWMSCQVPGCKNNRPEDGIESCPHCDVSTWRKP